MNTLVNLEKENQTNINKPKSGLNENYNKQRIFFFYLLVRSLGKIKQK